MYGYIYITTNLVNGKRYIGQHRAEGFDSKYLGSGTIFVKALNKYGKSNFRTEIICECHDESELNEKEIFYIDKYDAVCREDFYNISFGGYRSGPRGLRSMYNPVLDKVIYVPEEIMYRYAERGFVKGNRPRSSESKERYSHSKLNLITVTNDKVTKYIHPEEFQSYILNGWRFGRIPTRLNQKDEKRKWMNKDGKSVMVKEIDIPQFVADGYRFGRTKFSSFERVAPAHNKGKKRIKIDGKVTYI